MRNVSLSSSVHTDVMSLSAAIFRFFRKSFNRHLGHTFYVHNFDFIHTQYKHIQIPAILVYNMRYDMRHYIVRDFGYYCKSWLDVVFLTLKLHYSSVMHFSELKWNEKWVRLPASPSSTLLLLFFPQIPQQHYPGYCVKASIGLAQNSITLSTSRYWVKDVWYLILSLPPSSTPWNEDTHSHSLSEKIQTCTGYSMRHDGMHIQSNLLNGCSFISHVVQ